MKKQELAFQIFLKRMPSGYYNNVNAKGYQSAINESYELAQLFLDAEKPEQTETQLSFNFTSPPESEL